MKRSLSAIPMFVALLLVGCSPPASVVASEPVASPTPSPPPTRYVKQPKTPEEEALRGAAGDREWGVVKSVEVTDGKVLVTMYQPKSYAMAESNALELCMAAVEAFEPTSVAVFASDGLVAGYGDGMRCRVI